MKVCFPVEMNNGAESEIFGHFGSAPGFVTFDTVSGEYGYIDNKNAVHEHGACNPAEALTGSGVNAVVVGGIGQGAMMRLISNGVDVYKADSGKVSADAQKFAVGGLVKLNVNVKMCGGGSHSCSH